jgi:hypothetical protein
MFTECFYLYIFCSKFNNFFTKYFHVVFFIEICFSFCTLWLVFITAVSWMCYLFRAIFILFYRSLFMEVAVFVLWRATLLRGISHHRTQRAPPASTHSPCEDRIVNSVVRELCADELTKTDNSDVSKTEKQLTERPRGKKKKSELLFSGEIKRTRELKFRNVCFHPLQDHASLGKHLFTRRLSQDNTRLGHLRTYHISRNNTGCGERILTSLLSQDNTSLGYLRTFHLSSENTGLGQRVLTSHPSQDNTSLEHYDHTIFHWLIHA